MIRTEDQVFRRVRPPEARGIGGRSVHASLVGTDEDGRYGGMTNEWIACVRDEDRPAVERVLYRMSADVDIRYVRNACELRNSFRVEEPRTVCALVGPSPEGVSDVNLAAAVVHDGYADQVVLATRELSGSLRTRALQAGINRVIELGTDGISAAKDLDLPKAVPSGKNQLQVEEPGRVSVASEPASPPVIPTRPASGLVHEEGCPVLTLVSGRGGVGKTSICAVMGVLAGAWGMSVALVDLDLSCGNLAACFTTGRGGDLTRLGSLPKGPGFSTEVARLGMACAERVSLWGPCDLPELAETIMPHVADLIATLRASHDVVIVDTPTTCTDAVAQAMQAADRLVCVHRPGGGNIASLARTSALAVRLGVTRTRIVRVESQAEPRAWGRPFEPRVEPGLETARAYRVVEATPDVIEIMESGATPDLASLDDDFSRSVATLLASLLEELGSLPENEDAGRAARGAYVRKAFPLFGRRKEAV